MQNMQNVKESTQPGVGVVTANNVEQKTDAIRDKVIALAAKL